MDKRQGIGTGIHNGDIFCRQIPITNWRYNYYQIVELRGKTQVVLHAILTEGFINEGIAKKSPPYWSRDLRGFFGTEYRARVIAAINQEVRLYCSRAGNSMVPAFDELARISLVQRRHPLQDVFINDLEIALLGAGAAVEELNDEKQAALEPDCRYTEAFREAEIEQAQREIFTLRDALS